MTRRGFLAGAAALALGALGRRALGDVSVRARAAAGSLDGAIARARSRGRPLVVLVIPRAYSDRLDRGHAFGEWLEHGSDADLAPLALCEVTCTSAAELERALGWNGVGEPLLAFIEYDRAPLPLPQRLDARLPSVPELCTWCTDQTESRREADAVIDARIALLGGWVRARVARRDPGFASFDARRLAELAAEVRGELRDRAPAGARWAWADVPYGARLDNEPPREAGFEMIARRTQRMLYLFDD